MKETETRFGFFFMLAHAIYDDILYLRILRQENKRFLMAFLAKIRYTYTERLAGGFMSKLESIQQNIQRIDEQAKPLRKVSHLYSYLRLACITGAVVLAIVADQSGKNLGFYIAGAFLVLFLLLVYKHNQIKQELLMKEAKIDVLTHLCARFDDTWKQETSESYAEKEDTVSIDLDILGDRSLYQYLNMAATPYGKERLVEAFCRQDTSKQDIRKRQQAIQELLRKEEDLLALEASSRLFQKDCMKIKKEAFDFLIAYGKEETPVFPSWVYQASLLMVGLTFVTLCLGFLHVIPYGYSAVLMLVNLILGFLIIGKSGEALAFTKNLERILKDYQIMFETMQSLTFQDGYLCELQETMKEGSEGIRKLVSVMNLVSMRHNFISYLLLGILIQLDFRCLKSLEDWRRQYGVDIETWLYAAGDVEVLCSLCVLGQVKEHICYPEIVDSDTPVYEIVQGAHPLIKEDNAIANSITLTDGSVVITGSNMSGKTTFLRTLGVHMLLCHAGAPVCASYMKTSLARVYTSMRVRDDVSEGISTFYAELLRIRHMMEDAKQKQPMLVLIDEIFKGTNSADRILCARTAIERLHLPWIITLVSTHDFELCELENVSNIQAVNYHFSEYYEGDEIHFDYTLKAGRCTSTNAQQLMKLAGF